jgi:hypothetical protein
VSDKPWKRHERETARLLGGQRHRVTGLERGAAPDVEHDQLSIECKHRESVPKWIKNAMDQAEASIKSKDQVPIVVIHEKNQRRENDLVVMKMKHFQEISWWEDE